MSADAALIAIVSRFFGDKIDQGTVAGAERQFPHQLWDEVAELGLPWVGVSEPLGGAGGTLADQLAVAQLSGQHAVPLPLAETFLASALLAGAGLDMPHGDPGSITAGQRDDSLELHAGRTLDGWPHAVPWARHVTWVVAFARQGGKETGVVFDPRLCTVTERADLADQPRDRLELSAVPVIAVLYGVSSDQLHHLGMLVRAAQMAGAIQRVLSLTSIYTADRVQFGRRIAEFQSVQAHLVTLAELVTLTSLAVELAGAAYAERGASGMTREYQLQQFTRRLHAWRGDFADRDTMADLIATELIRTGSLTRAVTG